MTENGKGLAVSGGEKGPQGKNLNGNSPNNGGSKKSVELQKLSVLPANTKSVAIRVSPTPARKKMAMAKNPISKVGEKKKKTKSKRRNQMSGSAIFLSFLMALVAVALVAWVVMQVRRLDDKLMGLITELDDKAEVVARSLLKDCVYARPWDRIQGVTRVFPVFHPLGMDVYCDQITDGGGWTVFQRRANGSENFYRDWNDYVRGFGSLEGDMWTGLDWLHQITTNSGSPYELRIDMEDFEGGSAFAKYRKFRIGAANTGYMLHVSGYRGTAGDALKYHNLMKFSTYDEDNDKADDKNCAASHHGAWWYKACHSSNLNGRYKGGEHKSYADGVNWRFWKGDHYSLKVVEMKIRRKR